MEQSILKSVKKILGLDATDTSFDLDILTHINSAFSTLHDLGLGPDDGFMIEDDEPVWADYGESDQVLNRVKTYVCLKSRIIFDPPTTSYAITAINEQIRELEWRLNREREETAWVDPDPPDIPEDSFGDPAIVDGGDA